VVFVVVVVVVITLGDSLELIHCRTSLFDDRSFACRGACHSPNCGYSPSLPKTVPNDSRTTGDAPCIPSKAAPSSS
jgi:hypothetical protein